MSPPEPSTLNTTHSSAAIHLTLTHSPLSLSDLSALVTLPTTGATVSFSGTTRSTFDGRNVARLSYTAYAPLALRTLSQIAAEVVDESGGAVQALALAHRLGDVPVGETSIVVCVSSAHRKAAWRAGEACLEKVKERAEIWKKEEFEEGKGVWRENRRVDGHGGHVAV